MSSPDKPVLKVAPCDHAAAKYAVENWHYSRSLPAGKLFKMGAWEGDRFLGCVIFAYGATPNLGKPYALVQTEVCELVRVALRSHRWPVSRIMRFALKALREENPGLRLVVSFADPNQGHHGGVYQAGGWVYSGKSADGRFFLIHGKVTHPRTVIGSGGENSIVGAKKIDPNATSVTVGGKYRYLFPLDEAMKRKVEPLRKPYPKRAGSSLGEHSVSNGKEGGSIPTPALKVTEA
jgi:hypothetical protein